MQTFLDRKAFTALVFQDRRIETGEGELDPLKRFAVMFGEATKDYVELEELRSAFHLIEVLFGTTPNYHVVAPNVIKLSSMTEFVWQKETGDGSILLFSASNCSGRSHILTFEAPHSSSLLELESFLDSLESNGLARKDEVRPKVQSTGKQQIELLRKKECLQRINEHGPSSLGENSRLSSLLDVLLPTDAYQIVQPTQLHDDRSEDLSWLVTYEGLTYMYRASFAEKYWPDGNYRCHLCSKTISKLQKTVHYYDAHEFRMALHEVGLSEVKGYSHPIYLEKLLGFPRVSREPGWVDRTDLQKHVVSLWSMAQEADKLTALALVQILLPIQPPMHLRCPDTIVHHGAIFSWEVEKETTMYKLIASLQSGKHAPLFYQQQKRRTDRDFRDPEPFVDTTAFLAALNELALARNVQEYQDDQIEMIMTGKDFIIRDQATEQSL